MGDMVGQLPIGKIVFMFVFYIISHIIIGKIAEHFKKQHESNILDEELKSNAKIWKIIFNWYAAAYVLVVLGIFYAN